MDLVRPGGPGIITHRPAGSSLLDVLREVMPELGGPVTFLVAP